MIDSFNFKPARPRLQAPVVWVVLWLACMCVPARASADAAIHPWEHVADDIAGIYAWPNLLFHLSAVAVTPPLVWKVDRPVQDYFQSHSPLGDGFGDAALIVGGVLPAALPLGLYLGGLAGDAAELASAGAAVLQAEVFQLVVVTTLKWVTDRAGPYPAGDPLARRWSQGLFRDSDDPADFNFNPFDVKGGLRWPSGHTASNVAMVSTLVAFYPDQLWLPLVGYPFALAVGVGMIEGDYHWLSDVAAGALFGHVIGWVVGRQFRAAFDARQHPPRKAPRSSLQFALVPTSDGLAMIGSF